MSFYVICPSFMFDELALFRKEQPPKQRVSMAANPFATHLLDAWHEQEVRLPTLA